MNCVMFTLLSIIISVVIYYILFPSVIQLCEIQTCPFCFGTDLCEEIYQNKIALEYKSFSDFTYNILSVKNVYFARYNSKSVVLKKLAHNSELKELLFKKRHFKDLVNFLISESRNKHFKICDKNTATLFLKLLKDKKDENLQTLLHVNIEPVLLDIFNHDHGWCVPKLYGYCGRLVIVENAGQPLNHIQNFNWFDRAYVAYQILQAVNNFTENHEIFRLYLTDISPDNIVVNQDLKVSFIDLENIILKENTVNGATHHTEHFDEETYMFSESQICESSVSDHNVYSVCRLLLSKNSPWPMMKNGLLHNPPDQIKTRFNKLFQYIESCVHTTSRFNLSDRILADLKYILQNYTKHFK